MNVDIYWEGINISDEVLSYSRNQHICSGIGQLKLTIAGNSTRNFITYNEIVLVEDGNKTGTYFVVSIEKQKPEYDFVLTCQDETKKLSDYFIAESTLVTEPELNTVYIDKYLAEATVSCEYDTDEPGSLLSNDTNLGLVTAMEQLITLVQYSGWYFYADADNIIRIGKVELDSSNYVETITDTDIISFESRRDDKMLRNRVVVQGKGNVIDNTWVMADITENTPYNYDENDIRTVCLMNGYIADNATAMTIARRIMNETRRITFVKTVSLHGFHNVHVGQTVFMNSDRFIGYCLVTSVVCDVSPSGCVTTLVLDERCPRIIGYFNYGGYVYIGTWGSGVWRKHLRYSHTWEDFSTGLTNLNITDLNIYNGICAAVTENGFAFSRNEIQDKWSKLIIPELIDLEDNSYTQGELPDAEIGKVYASSACVDKALCKIYATFNSRPMDTANRRNWNLPEDITSWSDNKSWLVEFDGSGKYLSQKFVQTNLLSTLTNINIQSDGESINGQWFTEVSLQNWYRYFELLDGSEVFSTMEKESTVYDIPVKRQSPAIIQDHKVFFTAQTSGATFTNKRKFVMFDVVTREYTYSAEFTVSTIYIEGVGCFYDKASGYVYSVQGSKVWVWNLSDNSVSYVRDLPYFAGTKEMYREFVYVGSASYYTVYNVITDTLTTYTASAGQGFRGIKNGRLHSYGVAYALLAHPYLEGMLTLAAIINHSYIDLATGNLVRVVTNKTVKENSYVRFYDSTTFPQIDEPEDGACNETVFGASYGFDIFTGTFRLRENVVCSYQYIEDGVAKRRLVPYNIDVTSNGIVNFDSTVYVDPNLAYSSKLPIYGNLSNTIAMSEDIGLGGVVTLKAVNLDVSYFSIIGSEPVNKLDLFDNDVYTLKRTYTVFPSFHNTLVKYDKVSGIAVKEYTDSFVLQDGRTSELDASTYGENVLVSNYNGNARIIVFGTTEEFLVHFISNAYFFIRSKNGQFEQFSLDTNAAITEINQSLYLEYNPHSEEGVYNKVRMTYPSPSGVWSTLDTDEIIKDIRYFTTSKSFITVSGYDMVVAATGNGLLVVDLGTLVGSFVVASGDITHVETSNYDDPPFNFYTISGSFYQKSPEELNFVERKDSLPISEVTVIRCDDLI